MEVIRVVPKDSKGNPYPDGKERDLIFFNVEYNHHRDLCTDTTKEVADRVELAECRAVLCLPDSYTEDGERTQLVIACHGAGSTVDPEKHQTGGLAAVLSCLDAGYAALDIDGAAPNGLTMGNPEHVFALYRAYKYAIKHYNLTDRVFLAGHSMGGGTAINFANTFPSLAIALAVVNPGLSMHGVTVGDHVCRNPWNRKFEDGYRYRAPLCQYFRFPEEEFRSDLIAGFEPYRTRSFVNAEGERAVFPPCPVKIWQGADDKTVDPVLSREYYDSIRRAGCYAELHILDGVAHKVTDTAKKEIAIWFKRFL
jgi:alpha-beta hydrolase superfamily lysophospholipase